MNDKDNPRQLIVEGKEDKRVIPELIEANGIPWEDKSGNKIVNIQAFGNDEFINPFEISTQLKAPGLTALGLIVDADNEFNSRWDSVKNACSKVIPDFPQEMPETGLITSARNGINFGVWIMPDNRNRGMLETFLQYLIPDNQDRIWQYAQQTTQEAKKIGAPFIDNHYDKARIYTWLAWQELPGRQLHDAIKQKIFHPEHPRAQIFVQWFKKLYDLNN